MTECIGFTLNQTKPIEERRNASATIEQHFNYAVHRSPEREISYKKIGLLSMRPREIGRAHMTEHS